MQNPSSLSGLPVEILSMISEFSPKADLVALCRTNLRIRSICVRFIYRTVELQNPARVVKFCETLTANMSYAQEVRFPTIVCCPIETSLQTFPRHTSICHTESHEFGLSAFPYPHQSPPPSIWRAFTATSEARNPACAIYRSIPAWASGPHLALSPPRLSASFIYDANPHASSGKLLWPRRFRRHGRAAFSHISLSIWWDTRRLQLNISSEDILGIWDISLLPAIVANMPHLATLDFRNISTPV
ncbi:hypothetical protein B0H11DRAFT_2295384 [Mycena galericulata]|nr:hypothetical protein B0H11DRAFT_2295384 [Mycena galericulata]